MVREMIEGLERVARIRMVGDTVVASAIEILEDMDSGLIMLSAWSITVRGKEGQRGRNIGTGALSQPVNRADNTLVDFGTTLKVRIVCI